MKRWGEGGQDVAKHVRLTKLEELGKTWGLGVAGEHRFPPPAMSLGRAFVRDLGDSIVWCCKVCFVLFC